MAQLNYTANTQELETSFDALPAGEYSVIIEASEMVTPKSGVGQMLKLTYQVIDGPQKGKKLFENLNLENKNQDAVAIARRALNSIMFSVGKPNVGDSSELHNIPLKLDVRVEESEKYGRQNRIKKHLPMSGKIEVPAEQSTTGQLPGKDNGPAQPWLKK